MSDGRKTYSFQDLSRQLRAAQGDDTAIVAILWTWLESHLLKLSALEEKPPSIRQAAYAAAPYEGIDRTTLKWLEKSPLRNAAELPARIGKCYEDRDEPLLEMKQGIGATEVIVAVRRPSLALAMKPGDDDLEPPSTVEHPSLSTLAPRLLVCPTGDERNPVGSTGHARS